MESTEKLIIPEKPKEFGVESVVETPELSPEEKLNNLDGQIASNNSEIDISSKSIVNTEEKLGEVRNDLELPPMNEEPPSILTEREKIEKLKAEQEELERQKEEITGGENAGEGSPEEEEESQESKENKEKRERLDQISEKKGMNAETQISNLTDRNERRVGIYNLSRERLANFPSTTDEFLERFDGIESESQGLVSRHIKETQENCDLIQEKIKLLPLENVTAEDLDMLDRLMDEEAIRIEDQDKKGNDSLDRWEEKANKIPDLKKKVEKPEDLVDQINTLLKTADDLALPGSEGVENNKLLLVECARNLCQSILSYYTEKVFSYVKVLNDPIGAIPFLEKRELFRNVLHNLDGLEELPEDFLKKVKENYEPDDENSPENRYIRQFKKYSK